jgi:hypothetical protein
MTHAHTQERFCRAILDPEALVPCNLARSVAGRPTRRFAVYRNNVVTGLIDALAARFPAVSAIVGEEFFADMARRFIGLCPPSSPIIAEYGHAFPEFIGDFARVSSLPYLADIARLEIARTQAFHAANANPASVNALRELDSNALDRLKIELHPAMRLLRSRFPIVTIWAMSMGEIEAAPIETWNGEDVLVARPAFTVHMHRVTHAQFAFLSALGAGMHLSQALDAASAESRDFNPASAIADLIALGLATSFAQ